MTDVNSSDLLIEGVNPLTIVCINIENCLGDWEVFIMTSSSKKVRTMQTKDPKEAKAHWKELNSRLETFLQRLIASR